jgi:hypothetical protein
MQGEGGEFYSKVWFTTPPIWGGHKGIRVVQKPQPFGLKFLNNFRLKTAKCGAFCKICSIINRVIEQVN